ncbi:hypothetical protein Cgig2_015201 [Carnegiea gigantea]|uniref:C2 domain-containing protein n=1 Tax=Carnegiea gigantea TaxID=171969 RepID=A0A9Q1QM78_9CARY|nr:hypothetical protein Cgig2_015201 [Carnegiea gigantea]
MEYRPIEVKLACAKDLKDVNVFSTMDVYVIGSVSGDPRNMQRSPVHKDGGINPEWNFQMRFAVDESAARMNRLGLVFQIMSERTLGDREIGRVYVPLKELFDAGDGNSGEERRVTYQVQTPSGKFKGVLEFSFKFGEKFIQSLDWTLDEPVRTYPTQPGPAFGSMSEDRGTPALGEPPLPGYVTHGYPGQAPAGYGYSPPGSSRMCTCGATRSGAAQ